jgi:hypothetical protein
MDGFEFAETEAARVTGIPQLCFRAVRKTRTVLEGADWAKVDGRVMYSREGLKKTVAGMSSLKGAEAAPSLDAALGVDWPDFCLLPDAEALDAGKKNDGACGVSAGSEVILRSSVVEEARVTRFFLNPKVLEARLEKSSAPVRVRVKSSVNFVRGMLIKVRPLDAHLWELVGRCPRFRGKF